MESKRESYVIDGKVYTVFSQSKECSDSSVIYDVFVRYALEKIEENIRNNNYSLGDWF